MSPIVLLRNEPAPAGTGGSVGPGAQASQERRGRPGPIWPAGSGRKWGHRTRLGRGPRLEGPRAPPRLAGPGCSPAGGRGWPARRGRPCPGRADRVGGSHCRCREAAAGPEPAPSRSQAARPTPPLRGKHPPLARPGARQGRRGSPGPHVCALPGGGVPGRARAAVRGGRGVPRTPSLLLLPPRPPLPLPSSCAVPSSARAGGSARRVRSGRALREAGAPGGGGGGRDGGGGGGAGRETLPLCALRPGGGGQAALPSPASRPWRKNTRRNCSLSSAPTTPYLLTSCLGPGWVRVKNPPGQDDPFSGDCCWCPSPDPGPQQVGEWPPTEPDQTAAEEVKRG
ncbi:uncharacterized protein LOC144333727 isoform X1 [Macaca mulatta]